MCNTKLRFASNLLVENAHDESAHGGERYDRSEKSSKRRKEDAKAIGETIDIQPRGEECVHDSPTAI